MSSSLFVVPKQVQQSESSPQEVETDSIEMSGDAQADTETALRAIAFLIEFVQLADPGELRRCVEICRQYRERQR